MNFEQDLLTLAPKLKDKKYAISLYGALCNVDWLHVSAPSDWFNLLEQEKEDWKRRADVFWRKWPRDFSHWLRGKLWHLTHYKAKEEAEVFGRKCQTTVIKDRKFLGRLDIWLCLVPIRLMPDWPEPHPWIYGCSWRSAGALVAEIRNEGEDYLHYYCSGNEGEISEDVEDDLIKLGWRPIKLEK